MIHFTREQKVLLSNREIEPGRIVVLLAWLHRLATSSSSSTLTSSAFEQNWSSLITVGDKLKEEINTCVQKKCSGTGAGTTEISRKQPASAHGRPNKRPASPLQSPDDVSSDLGVCLDLRAEDQRELEEERGKQLSLFSALRNYHHFGDPLPLTERAVQQVAETNNPETLTTSPYEERMSRLDASKG